MSYPLDKPWEIYDLKGSYRGASLWLYFARGCTPPFRLEYDFQSNDLGGCNHVIVDANDALCMFTFHEEGVMVTTDWNQNAALYAMVADTAAWEEMIKTI